MSSNSNLIPEVARQRRPRALQREPQTLEQSLERLGLAYVDLDLIHWPQPSLDRYVETWEGLIEARERGLTRSIGVSNFNAPHLERVISATGGRTGSDRELF